jgi:ribose transport system substrate-binding protein
MTHLLRQISRDCFVIVSAAAIAVGATSCSKDQTPSGPAHVAFIIPTTESNFAKEMAAGFSFGVESVGGVHLVVSGPRIVDGPREVALFEKATTEAPDGISVFTLHPELFARPLAQAAKAGIPLIAVDNPPVAGSPVKLFVGNDNYALGVALADEVIQRLPAGSKGSIVLGTPSPGTPILEQRAKGMTARLTEKLPGIAVVGPFDTKQEVAANRAAWETLVRANPEALAFLGTGNTDGFNLADIRLKTGGKWLAGAYDLEEKSLRAVKDGRLLLVSPEHFLKGAIAGRLQARLAKDNTALPAGWIYTPGLTITTANIDEIIARQTSAKSRADWFADEIDQTMKNINGSLRPLKGAG